MKNPLYGLIFVIVLVTLYTIADTYGAEYEVNEDNEIISGTIPEDYEGAINGYVSLPDGTIFEGKAQFKEGEVFVESGNINGLTIEHGIFSRSGSISIEGIGKVNGIEVSNVINVRREVNGFSGYATEEVPTIVHDVRIQPAGTYFQYPSRSGQGVTITASAVEAGSGVGIPTRVTLGNFPGYYLEIESGKQIDLESDGSYTTEMYGITNVFIPPWNGGSFLLNPHGTLTEGHHDSHQHTIRTAEGEIVTTDSSGRDYHFKAREGFANELSISEQFIRAEGGWKFDVNAEDYTLEGTTGLYYDDKAYPGSVMLEAKETLALSGENLLTRIRASNDFSMVSTDVVVNGIDGGVFHYVSPFSLELNTLMENSFPGSSEEHHARLLNQMEDHHPQQIAEESLSSHHHDGEESATHLLGTSGHETHSSTTDIHSGTSTGEIHGHGGHETESNYKLSITYQPVETVLGYNILVTAFYEGESVEDHAAHVDYLNPHGLGEPGEEEHHDHDEHGG
ncbi:hypothetical protein HYW21_02590 [Candidatus Woesearchaeota archaeon]|nr:hypothetical protein [Candidatus Woesearchaeota archaeon]